MLMLRLQRVGRRNEAHFKVVVIEKSKGPKSHKYVDIVGSYNPKLGNVQLDEEKVKKWLENGVQPSDTVRNILITKGIIEGKKVNVLPQKSPVVKEVEEVKDTVEKAEESISDNPEEVSVEESSEEPQIEAEEAPEVKETLDEVVEEEKESTEEDKKTEE